MNKYDKNSMDYRLPTNLKPTQYQLEIQVCALISFCFLNMYLFLSRKIFHLAISSREAF